MTDSDNEMDYNHKTNTNYNNLSSVLTRLNQLKNEVDHAADIRLKITKDLQQTEKSKNELKNMMLDSVSNLTNNLEEKVREMLNILKSHSEEQRSSGLRIQQEIASLKKEKYDLLNQVANLSKRIQEIETIIGYDPR